MNKEKILQKLNELHVRGKRWFEALSLQHQIILLLSTATLIAVFIGPCTEFKSSRKLAEDEALSRGMAIARLLAAENKSALIAGRDVLFNIDVVAGERGVKEAFLTDSTGLIVAPASRFHEDARKDDLIRSGLKQNDLMVSSKGLGVYDIAAPVLNGQDHIGVARITFLTRDASIWRPLWNLSKTIVLMAFIMFAGCYGVFALLKKQTAAGPPPISEEKPADFMEDTRINSSAAFEHVNSPVILFDASFRINYANSAARKLVPGLVGRHLMDMKNIFKNGGVFVEMAEELEMLQKESVKRDNIGLWRIKEGDELKGYGLTF